jgi:MerR family transcriptional regulator, light-induced transcriptional regulator
MENLYTIKKVAEITGLSVHAIRAWEKRYKVVIPERTDTNRRLYSKNDVEKLRLLHEASKNGFSIGSIAGLNIDQLKELLPSKTFENTSTSHNSTNNFDKSIEDNIVKCVEAIKNLDSKTLEDELNQALVNYSQPKLIKEVIFPLIEKIGELWKSGEIRIVNEHISTTVIRKFLTSLIDNNRVGANSPILVVATPKGQLHELGALIISVVASADGWNVVYMGPDLPGEEIVAAIEKLHPKVVALSIVYPTDDIMLEREMIKIKKLMTNGTQIIAGGRSVYSYEKTLNEMNAKIIIDIDEFRKELEKVRN